MENFAKQFNKQFGRVAKIELLVSSLIFGLALLTILLEEPKLYGRLFGISNLLEFLVATLVYLSFLTIYFFVLPNFINGTRIAQSFFAALFSIGISYFVLSVIKPSYLLLVLCAVFSAIIILKFLWKLFWKFSRQRGLFKSLLSLAALFYIFLMFFLLLGQANVFATTLAGMIIPAAMAISVYIFYRVLPNLRTGRWAYFRYLFKSLIPSVLLSVPLSIVAALLTDQDDLIGVIMTFNIVIHILIVAPLTWLVFKFQKKQNAEYRTLQTELGKSEAELDFLRSQINPHFLFNALNTIYGTAIQEKAQKTSEAIQHLGDMMRFMLHENVQDKIPLYKEIDYLRNYIELQRLRLEKSSDIKVESILAEVGLAGKVISPMLLIPFVENAFKYGISLRKKSYIKIELKIVDNKLYFNVINSNFSHNNKALESLKSGIGLQNVKQRLKLLYPGQYILKIEDDTSEFKVNLQLELI